MAHLSLDPSGEGAPAGGEIPGASNRRRFGALRRLYMTLRAEHRSPSRVGAAVAIGVFIGCSPFWGLHLALCLLVATALGLNRVLVYAAANLANPLTAVPLIVVEIQVGYRLLHGHWLELAIPRSAAEAVAAGKLAFLGWILGSVVVGGALAILFGAAALVLSRAGRYSDSYHDVADRVALRYLEVSIRDAEAARSSLLRNPVWSFLADDPAATLARRVVDLGCGRGLAAAVFLESSPSARSYLGVDVSGRYLRVAQRVFAHAPAHEFLATDLRDFDPPPADLTLLINTLHFLPVAAQDALLRRIARAARPGARLIVRDIDAGRGWAARMALARESLVLLLPGRARYGLHARRASDLRNALIAAGFDVRDVASPRSATRGRVTLDALRRPDVEPPVGVA